MWTGGKPGTGLRPSCPPLAELAFGAGQDGGGIWAVVALQHQHRKGIAEVCIWAIAYTSLLISAC